MGMWSNDQRHGFGVVVTVDGVYYEGKFVQNRLAVSSMLMYFLYLFKCSFQACLKILIIKQL